MPPESENPLQLLTAARVVVVAGKGGVGKTTVTAVIAHAAASDGRRVLAVELDGKDTLDSLLPDVDVMHISAPDALDEYLREHGFARIAKRLNRTGVIDVVGTAAPGIDDIVVLGKIKQIERSGEYDVIVVDGPAAGHAITFLTSAAGLSDTARGGPVRHQADEVQELLHDAERCHVVLVTLPETTPVNEVVETAFALEEDVGVQLGPVVVNALDHGIEVPSGAEIAGRELPAEVVAAAEFRRSRRTMEDEELSRLTTELPLTQVRLPAVPVAGLTDDDIGRLAESLTSDGSP
ncbi:MAG: ArsA family ATPase [Ilumatobacteraceae bacterium]